MGYTHYWEFRKPVNEIENGYEKYRKAVAMFKEGLKKMPEVELGNGVGKDEPIITDTKLVFNGRADKGEDYETFSICVDNEDCYDFDFCKTARQPYDPAVCLALLCFKEAFGDNFSYRSDGCMGEEGWPKALEIMEGLKT